MRSEATMSSRSPMSYMSRPLPEAMSGRSASLVVTGRRLATAAGRFRVGALVHSRPRTDALQRRVNGGRSLIPAKKVTVSSQPAVPSGPDDESAVQNLAASLRRRMAILVLAIIALPVGALAYSLTAEKQYTATAKLLFRDPGFDQRLFGGQVLAPSVDPAREAATNVGLVSLDTVAQRAAESLKDRRLTPEELKGKVTVAAQGQSNVVAVDATDPDPVFAALLANTVASQYIVFRREADRKKISQAVGLVRRQLENLTPERRNGREGRSLSRQVEQLGVLAALQTGNAERVQRAEVPDEPSSPQVVRNVILALLVGIVIGVGLALLR